MFPDLDFRVSSIRIIYVKAARMLIFRTEKKFPSLLARMLSENKISYVRVEQLKSYLWEAYLEIALVYFEDCSYYYS
jgi:hypothetical protein